ncbi:hypothetical protein MtrunA17_Chr2g0308801 [Medicago truncatula]|uniref:Transmembrane protein, putative n=1 Tax=Medicago truncatula TaxID=3880 RepID=A0A072V9U4_MEDTR|nr:uncharacterized protein LOC25486860 [Medicago truncatula]KEH38168.1 transmembrane protein, putative [Medicago truncatula]KEH38170.1 transmembrane protein, putative [Medicago truncatula]RHN74302.1 hypothetical protein MtrunA17_Chr2g0308801 [Medicago truncatula]
MASVGFSSLSSPARSQYLNIGFPSKPQFLPTATLNFSPTFRCIGSRKLQINRKLLTVSATNPNSGGGKSSNEGSDVKETGNASQGPPLLTILAGLFVFFLVGWVIGSVVVWLISLIVNVPSPK